MPGTRGGWGGTRPPAETPANNADCVEPEAKAEAISSTSHIGDADLARIIGAWPMLPAAVQVAILAIIEQDA